MRNRTILLLLLPTALSCAALAVAWTRDRERCRVAEGRPAGRPHLWMLTLVGALAGLAGGILVGLASGRAAGHDSLGNDAMDGTFLLVPGMLCGLAAGTARALTIRVVRRRRRARRTPRRR